VKKDIKEATINQNIVALQNPVDCLPEYVWYCLRSPTYNARLVSLGVGIRQSFINTTKIRELKIPIPPLDIQTQIVSLLNRVHTLVSSMLAKQMKMLTEIDSLGNSILECA
jgi:type I restriction enzyme S subunit